MVAQLVATWAAFNLTHPRWTSCFAGIAFGEAVVGTVSLTNGKPEELYSALGLCAASAVIFLGCRQLIRIDVPEFGLWPADFSKLPRVKRPSFLASGRYLEILYYAFASTVFSFFGIAIALFLCDIQLIVGYILPFTLRTLKLFGPDMVRPLMYAGSEASRMRRCYGSPQARVVLRSDIRRPVLLLRSFTDDALRFTDLSWLEDVYQSDRTFEEFITDRLWAVGPVVAIGRPNERIPLSGAVREYLSHDDWRSRVSELVKSAEIVVIILGSTPGLVGSCKAWRRPALCTNFCSSSRPYPHK